MPTPDTNPLSPPAELLESVSLRLFVESAPSAMAMSDREMRYLAVSERWRLDYRLGDQPLIGRSHYEVFPEIPERWKAIHRRALAGEVIRADADRFDRADGSTQWLRWEVRPWRKHGDGVGGLVMFSEDITALKVVEDSLRQERDLNAAIINTAPMIVLLLDPAGRILQFNPYTERLTGWTLAEVRGRDWFETFLPEGDRGRIRQLFRRSLDVEPTRANINPILTRTGEMRDIEWYDEPLSDGRGALVGLIALGLDVTERRWSEDALRAVLDTAADAIITISERGMIEQVNPATERLFGYASRELVGRNVAVLMPEPHTSEHDGYLAHYVRTGEKRVIGIGREAVARRKDGSTFAIELSVTENHGPPRRFTGFVRDITERKQLEAKLLRAQRLESIGTLVSGIAHDLNNVLTPVLMAVKLLKKDRPGLDKADLLDTAQRSIERGADMLRQLLAFGGRLTGEKVTVHLTPLVADVVGLLEHALPKSIAIRREWADVPDSVSGDPTQLAQVIMNLCVNARDAMPDGGTLTLSLTATSLDARGVTTHPGATPGPYLILSVADTGTGIPAHVQEKMFDPFFTTKPQGQGTGLGLSTALGIVRAHGGFVSVYSEPTHGTKVSVYLPAVAHKGTAANGRAAEKIASGHGECVLVVDDEPAILATVGAALDDHGYRALRAPGGAEALALFAEHRSQVRLLLVDMMMPGVDGPVVMADIRRQAPDLPILAASGLPPTGRYADAIAAASAKFISKPYSDEELLSAVGRLIAGS